jgi:hypothetical protein
MGVNQPTIGRDDEIPPKLVRVLSRSSDSITPEHQGEISPENPGTQQPIPGCRFQAKQPIQPTIRIGRQRKRPAMQFLVGWKPLGRSEGDHDHLGPESSDRLVMATHLDQVPLTG